MQWLELTVSLEAGGDFVLVSLNCLYLIELAREARTAARRTGAMALAAVSASSALEALLFLSQAPPHGALARWAALLLVRTALLVSAALVSLLIARSLWLRRR